MEYILTTRQLSKYFYQKKALYKIDINIEKGKIYGILGPNGGGKSTLLKLAAGLLKPSQGEIMIDNKNPGVYTKSIISYLPENNYFYKWMKIGDALSFFRDFYEDFDIEKARKSMEFMKLEEKEKISNLSKGMLGRLKLTLALSRNAKLYLLDEPLNGIDPVSREKIITSILDTFNQKSTIVICSHLIYYIEKLLDYVFFLSEGQIILAGEAEDLRNKRDVSIDNLYQEVFQ
ncbi:MAG: ABC transporter ATP-binding protein [Candidatus Caldatribacteriota bacterium]|nr:ABC transporter ATP-binding protein [Candidatus Caldatribacteriota bacterium]